MRDPNHPLIHPLASITSEHQLANELCTGAASTLRAVVELLDLALNPFVPVPESAALVREAREQIEDLWALFDAGSHMTLRADREHSMGESVTTVASAPLLNS